MTLARTLARIPLAPVIAVMFGVAAATLVALTPQWRFESMIASSGLGDLVSVARPPLGMKARLLAVVAAFVTVACILYVAARAFAMLGRVAQRPRRTPSDDALDLAAFLAPETIVPTRKPIFADRDLGAPLMSDEALGWVEEPPVIPRFVDSEPVEAVAEPEPTIDLAAPLRIEEFELPAAEPDALPVAEISDEDDSIAALVARLEAGLARRDAPQRPRPGGAALREGPPELSLIASTPRDDSGPNMAMRTLKRMAGR